MHIPRRPNGLAHLRILAAAAVSGAAYALYLMACKGPTGPVIYLAAPTQLAGVVNTPYSAQFSAAGGSPPLAFAIVSGPTTVPSGLSLNPSGLLSGTPTAAGTYHPIIEVRDHLNQYKIDTVTVAIALEITPTTLAAGTSGSAYSVQLAAVGGTPPYNWLLQSGVLPPGLTLSPGGLVSGTPAAAGPFTVAVEATDASSDTGQQPYTLTIAQGACTISPAKLPGASIAQPFSAVLTATSACTSVAPAAYSQWIVVGTLPPGFTLSPMSGTNSTTLSSTGPVNGLPGTYNFSITFQGIDPGPPMSGQNVTQAYSVTVSD